ncbi:FecR family protein [Pseudoflavitalea sp. G-6-1-2]|uniref:FecR family protein n=1 Tax=Pseudoflavitalea sp. G-6-1-2 TaxID=2728841 RepID=UPI00146D36BA|nr:FecR family protein [Pseudoflavitalea sp. G-6-1-2]NML23000.1 FecR family protein [Pseudoflavitalea sp. G-6-1-2]
MKNLRIAAIIKKSLSGEISSEERKVLTDWLAVSAKRQEFFERIKADNNYLAEQASVLDEANWQNAYAKFSEEHLEDFDNGKAKNRYKRFYIGVAIAATFLLMIMAGIYLYLNNSKNKVEDTIAKMKGEVMPAKGDLTLTLANGQTIDLGKNTQKEVIAKQGNSDVILAANELSYTADGSNADTSMMNRISTGKGGYFVLKMADGTNVWLNAMTSIKFPASFGSGPRKVEIFGEAFFKVAPDKRPFIVTTKNNTQIQVLGTQFNVNAYDNSHSINTTLIQGSVLVRSNNQAAKLIPGEQSVITDQGNSEVRKTINQDQVLAWIEKKFYFRQASVDEIMNELKKNYDIKEVIVEKKSSEKFNGIISKKIPLSEVLRIFSSTQLIDFEILNGNTVVIK